MLRSVRANSASARNGKPVSNGVGGGGGGTRSGTRVPQKSSMRSSAPMPTSRGGSGCGLRLICSRRSAPGDAMAPAQGEAAAWPVWRARSCALANCSRASSCGCSGSPHT
jgi:hypothetical protein